MSIYGYKQEYLTQICEQPGSHGYSAVPLYRVDTFSESQESSLLPEAHFALFLSENRDDCQTQLIGNKPKFQLYLKRITEIACPPSQNIYSQLLEILEPVGSAPIGFITLCQEVSTKNQELFFPILYVHARLVSQTDLILSLIHKVALRIYNENLVELNQRRADAK